MPRNRMIKPEFWSSKTLNRISLESRLTFIGLWNFADDYGVLLDSSRRILGDVYPLDDDMTEQKIDDQKQELIGVGLLLPVQHNGQNFLIITGWSEHQSVPNPSKRYHIEPDEIKVYLESNESLIRSDLYKEKEQRIKSKEQRVKNKDQSTTSRGDFSEDFETFWTSTKFPKRPQDTKGDMKKKYIACRKAKLSHSELLLASDIFAEVHMGNEFAIGMRRFLTPETVREYLDDDIQGKIKSSAGPTGNPTVDACKELMAEAMARPDNDDTMPF